MTYIPGIHTYNKPTTYRETTPPYEYHLLPLLDAIKASRYMIDVAGSHVGRISIPLFTLNKSK